MQDDKRQGEAVPEPEVHVLTYTHAYGADVIVCDTQDSAAKALYEIVLYYIDDDVRDASQRMAIREAVRARDLAGVIQLWAKETDEEFDIEVHPIITAESDEYIDLAVKDSEARDAVRGDDGDEGDTGDADEDETT